MSHRAALGLASGALSSARSVIFSVFTCPNVHLSHVSHAGWRQSSFPAYSTTLVRISGLLASLPSNWRRGVPQGLESPLVLCFCRCE